MRYEVMDLSRDGALASLQDGAGRLHLAQLQGGALRRGEVVRGRDAALGEQRLLRVNRHALLQVRFESIGCTQDEALGRLHPVHGESARPVVKA